MNVQAGQDDEELNILDISKFSFEGDFEHQVNELLLTVRLTRTEVENLQFLINDVERTLNVPFPGCKVYPFGSIITGLGIATSDIDCYVSLPRWVKIKNKLVWRAKHYLQEQALLFRDLTAIPMAKVPIVKFFHIPTQRHCDINFSSIAGVKNSNLLAYLLHVDARALPLAVLIKYWSKLYNLTGTNLMPNYSLTLLVVFYLQQIEILPPVHLLQQTVRADMVDKWNSAFDSIPFAGADNTLTLYQLLGGFFDFYSSFDFENKIVSTYLGRTVNREHFKLFDTIPQEYELYRKNLREGICKELRIDTKFCIQDPFDHSRNCAVGVHPKLFNIVLRYFKKSAELFYSVESHNYLRAVLTIVPEKADGVNLRNIQNMPHRNQTNKVMKEKHRKQNNIHQNIKKNLHMLYSEIKKGKR